MPPRDEVRAHPAHRSRHARSLAALKRRTFAPLGRLRVETGALSREQMTEFREAYLQSQQTKSRAAQRDHAA